MPPTSKTTKILIAALALVGVIGLASASMGPPAGVDLSLSGDAGGSAGNPLYIKTAAGGAAQPVTIAAPVDGGFGSPAAPAYTIVEQMPSASLSTAGDAGGAFSNPLRTQGVALCLDVANKTGTTLALTPDAGMNCVQVLPNIQKRIYVTSDSCIKVGGIPTTCTTTAVSDGVRIASNSPEDMPLTGTPTVMADGGAVPDGGTATHILICGLPTSTAGVFELTPYSSCGATP